MSSVTFSNWGMQLEDWPMNIWRTDRSTLNPNISGWFSFPQRKGTTSRSTLPCCYTTQACRHSHRQSWYYQLPQDTDLFASTFRNFGCLLYVSESAMGVASNFSTKQCGTLWCVALLRPHKKGLLVEESDRAEQMKWWARGTARFNAQLRKNLLSCVLCVWGDAVYPQFVGLAFAHSKPC